MNHSSKIVAFLIVIGILVFGIYKYKTPDPQPTQSTQTNTNSSVPPGWTIFEDREKGLSIKYPEDFGTKYLSAFDWPPQIQILNQKYSCSLGGIDTQRAGQTSSQTINGHAYCITKVVEGAAGSMYTQYAFAFPKDNRTVILTFSTRQPQCDNYDDPEKTLCKNERDSFDLNSLIDKIAQSLILK